MCNNIPFLWLSLDKKFRNNGVSTVLEIDKIKGIKIMKMKQDGIIVLKNGEEFEYIPVNRKRIPKNVPMISVFGRRSYGYLQKIKKKSLFRRTYSICATTFALQTFTRMFIVFGFLSILKLVGFVLNW